MPICWSSLFGVLLIATGAFADEPVWHYVAAPESTSSIRPIFRSVALSTTKPDDLRVEVRFRGREQHYAQIRYGSEDSRRVVVIVDEFSRDDFDLYVDADRNRVIDEKDRVAGTGKERTTRLDLETTRGLVMLSEPRSVRWRIGASRKSISLATLGFVEGTISLDGKTRKARRVDGNANGLFSDATDRLWIDLNGDNLWDPLSEQFPFTPVLDLGGKRFSLRGDARGTRLTVELLTGEGRVRLRMSQLPKGVTILKFEAMLISDDGSAFSIGSLDEPTIVPTGRYSLGSVAFSIRDAKGGQPTRFVFSRLGAETRTRWYELRKNEELVIDPVGKLQFGLEIPNDQATRKPEEAIRVQPQLFTEDGLLINSCVLGNSDEATNLTNQKQCTIRLDDNKQQLIDSQSSGFA